MKIILTIFFSVCLVIIVVSLQIQSRRKREKDRQSNLDAHMQMLNEGIKRIVQQNQDLDIENLEERIWQEFLATAEASYDKKNVLQPAVPL